MKTGNAHKAITILAFDFGARHIGVAVGDTETRMAHTLASVDSGRGGSYATRMASIDLLVGEWHPGRLVVGLPLGRDGEEQAMTAHARRFARQLGARYGLPVDFADERYTSAAAEEALGAAGRGGAKHKRLVHGEAARIILQSYFDESA